VDDKNDFSLFPISGKRAALEPQLSSSTTTTSTTISSSTTTSTTISSSGQSGKTFQNKPMSSRPIVADAVKREVDEERRAKEVSLATDNKLDDERLKATALNVYNTARNGGLDDDTCIKLYSDILKGGGKQRSTTNSAISAPVFPKSSSGIIGMTSSTSTEALMLKERPMKTSSSSSSSSTSTVIPKGGTSGISLAKSSQGSSGSKGKPSSSSKAFVSDSGSRGPISSSITASSTFANAASSPIGSSSDKWVSAMVPSDSKAPTYKASSKMLASTPQGTNVALHTPAPFGNASSSSSSSSSFAQGKRFQLLPQPLMVQQSLTNLWKSPREKK
jgi:hypothetical protein